MRGKVYLAADHRGFELKEKIFNYLVGMGLSVEDFGAYEYDPEDDYTIFAEKVASVVAKEKGSRGILICGSGVGVNVVANKFKGIRASLGKDPQQVEAGRRDDDMNILVLASDFTPYGEAEKMVDAFLKTKFDAKTRHKKRLEDIKRIESNN